MSEGPVNSGGQRGITILVWGQSLTSSPGRMSLLAKMTLRPPTASSMTVQFGTHELLTRERSP
jgi:hypothetical protein